MSQWFPQVDAAIGGTADVVDDAGDYVLGGIGSTIGGAVTGTADVAGDATGSLISPFVNAWLKLAALVLGAVVIIKVI